MKLQIPDFGTLEIKYLVSDFTGTLSVDGALVPGAAERLHRIAEELEIHILTADTFGKVHESLVGIPCTIHILKESGEERQKENYIEELGPANVFAMGNGRNDGRMLKAARVGVAVCLAEGCALEALQAADLHVNSTCDALDLLLKPLRLKAGLRR
ncbi:MAG: HAD family hydrolase [Planctomycetota bacterium]|jgi:soluble P-type ATPase